MDSNLGAENAVSKQSGSKTLGKFSEAFLLDSPPDPQLTGRIFIPSLVTYQLLPQ